MGNIYNEGLYLSGMLPTAAYDKDDILDIENSSILYARGFLVSKEHDLQITDSFHQKVLDNEYTIYYHNDLTIDYAECNKSCVYILGIAYFIDNEFINHEHSEASTLAAALNKSIEHFYDIAEYLAGRYVIIFKKDDDWFVINDPHGLKSVFYCKSAACIGSSLELVNIVAKQQESIVEKMIREKKLVFSSAYPGTYTKYNDIYFLTPNFSLSLNSYDLKRFFPRKPLIKSLSVEETKNEFINAMEISVKEIFRKGKKVCMSLTGGKDSRVSFYSLLNFKDQIFYYTESRDNDVKISNEIAKKYCLNWMGCSIKDFHFENNTISDAYWRIIDKNIFPHSVKYALRTQFWLANVFGLHSDWVHIHSNCAETGRGRLNPETSKYLYPYYSESFSYNLFYESVMESTYSYQTKEIKEYQKKTLSKSLEYNKIIQEYFEMLNYQAVQDLGYNPWDLVYAEQRNACYLSMIHTINDGVFESLSLTNCRQILYLMWQLPEKYINNCSLLYNCIINENETGEMGEKFVPKENDHELYEYIYGGKNICNTLNTLTDQINLCKEVLEANPTVEWAYIVLISKLLQDKKIDEALEWAYKMLQINEKLADHFIGDVLCNSIRSQRRFDDAEKYLNKCITLSGKSSWQFKQMSHIHSMRGNSESALEYAQRAYFLNKYDRWTVENYIKLLLAQNNTLKAYNILNELNNSTPNCSYIYYLYACYYEKEHNLLEAFNYAKKAHKLMPKDSEFSTCLSKIKELLIDFMKD